MRDTGCFNLLNLNMTKNHFAARHTALKREHAKLVNRKNRPQKMGNGIFDRYEYPVLTHEHVPLEWRYDLNPQTNPHLMTRCVTGKATRTSLVAVFIFIRNLHRVLQVRMEFKGSYYREVANDGCDCK
jgi:hypothetical protein